MSNIVDNLPPFSVQSSQEVMKMDEKIKISLPKETFQLLKKDCEDFKVLKENGTINMNSFVNTLIVNFYEEFSASEEQLHDEIKEALFSVPEAYKEKAFDEIIRVIAKRTSGERVKNESTTLSFKPTKMSEREITFIENVLIKKETISSFYRRMFIRYSQKTKNEREKIIHKENYQLLSRAIEKGTTVCITLRTNQILPSEAPYAVASSQDELFNYLLCYSDKDNHTIRLANIKSVSLLPQKASIPKKNEELFKKQLEQGVQYPFYPSDDEPIKVELTEKGKRLFQKIYLYRPTPSKIEGNIYTFNCSANQALYYFERFGDSAIILSPKRLGITMRNYHYYALKKYRTVYEKD